MKPHAQLRRLGLLAGLAAVYFVAGKLGLRLAFLNASATAVWAPAGIALAGLARWPEYGSIWLTWWLGDAVGDLVVAPAVILWAATPRVRWTRRQALEAAALLLCVGVVGIAVFGGVSPPPVRNYPLEFLCVPLVLWAAFRFGQRECAAVAVALSGIAIWGTLRGFGPFARGTQNESLVLLQAFVGITAVMTLALAAAVAERREVEERLRQLAVSDPLTGLANYRQLTHAQDGEKPALTVSLGVAVYPQDGATLEMLLSAADRGLYDDKARGRRKSPVR